MYFFINMQDSTPTAQNNIKEYAGPPLAGSSMPAQPAFLASAPNPSAVATPPIQNRINDIDYQLVSAFRDTIPTTQENSQVHLGATDPQQNEQVNNSKTLKEMVPILNQDSSRAIDMIKNNKSVEQWIMDVRRPWDEQKNDIIDLFKHCKDNSFVLRDYVELLIEYRFPCSFQINPII